MTVKKKPANAWATLIRLGACADAMNWFDPYRNDVAKAWRKCERGDWMLWIIGRTLKAEPWSDGRKPMVACAMECALLAKEYWPEKHKKELEANVAIIKNWCRGKATKEEAEKATRAAAYATAYAAYAAYDAAAAAYAAAYAAYDAAAYAAAAAAAAAAAYAAADAAYAATAYAARQKILSKCANIVRKHFPNPPKG
jgi:hypothetical protein